MAMKTEVTKLISYAHVLLSTGGCPEWWFGLNFCATASGNTEPGAIVTVSVKSAFSPRVI